MTVPQVVPSSITDQGAFNRVCRVSGHVFSLPDGRGRCIDCGGSLAPEDLPPDPAQALSGPSEQT